MGFFKPSRENKRSEIQIATEREQREHPWANRATAMRIAMDHLEEQEFFRVRRRR